MEPPVAFPFPGSSNNCGALPNQRGATPRPPCYPQLMVTELTPPTPSPTGPDGSRPALPVAVLGAGITGLTTAWHLHQQGVPVLVFDAATVAGGVIQSHREDGWLRETGPNTLFENSAEITTFIEGLGLGPRRLDAAPSAQKRYVVRAGQPVALPASPLQFVTTPLLSLGTKLSLLGEPFRRRAPADADESVAEFVNRRLGREFLDYIVNPFVAGVYAGTPEGLSVRHAFPKLHTLEQQHGSMIRGSLARRNASGGPRGRMISFPEGLAEIPRALATALGDRVRLGHRVDAVRRTATGWTIAVSANGTRSDVPVASIVSTLPPEALARLPFEGVPGADGRALLQTITQPPVATVFLGFRREDVAHPLDGFGLLNPAVEKRRILGTLFSSTLFPHRAPAGHVALTTFVGGTRQPHFALLDDDALLATVQEELGALLGVHGAPVYARIQRWPRAIPQYAVGYQKFKDACTALERAAPGFFVGGTTRDGVSLANCITAGRRLSEVVRQHLSLP